MCIYCVNIADVDRCKSERDHSYLNEGEYEFISLYLHVCLKGNHCLYFPNAKQYTIIDLC